MQPEMQKRHPDPQAETEDRGTTEGDMLIPRREHRRRESEKIMFDHSEGSRRVKGGFTCRNCGGGDRGRVAIYRPFGEVSLSLNHTAPVWCSRPTTGVPLAHATMNFVGLVLTTSDRRAVSLDDNLSAFILIFVTSLSIKDLTLPRAPKPNRHSRDLLYAISSYDIVAVNFLLHENPPALAGVKPATFGADGHLDKPK
ncbi:hypothetical protein TNCV_2194151 [Trichonephila clavipes]|uniref:Uncharacterized protein n=1 Tax=Trichonephila clavipes TaxID=2585209 RepID=A0A8X6VFD5_TRICX|nr:hypothetical protein TNCV_2194151 [Trichonephila clavipes]